MMATAVSMDVRAPGAGAGALVAFTALAAVALALAARLAVRRGWRWLAVLVALCAGSVLALANEPIFDVLGKIYYPLNETRAFAAFGRGYPLFLIPGYLAFLGALPFAILLAIRAGATPRRLAAVAVASFGAVALVEALGTSTDHWVYYGEPPLRYLGVAPQMAVVPLAVAAAADWLERRLRGAVLLGALAAVPPMALAAGYAATGWPLYFALHAQLAGPLDWLAGAATLALCAGLAWAIAVGCAVERAAELPARAPAPGPRVGESIGDLA